MKVLITNTVHTANIHFIGQVMEVIGKSYWDYTKSSAYYKVKIPNDTRVGVVKCKHTEIVCATIYLGGE